MGTSKDALVDGKHTARFRAGEEGWEVVSVVSLMAKSSSDGLWPTVVGPWSSTDGLSCTKRVVCGWPNRCTFVADFRSNCAAVLGKVVVMPVVVE